jgi:hypothetical protein
VAVAGRACNVLIRCAIKPVNPGQETQPQQSIIFCLKPFVLEECLYAQKLPILFTLNENEDLLDVDQLLLELYLVTNFCWFHRKIGAKLDFVLCTKTHKTFRQPLFIFKTKITEI